VVLVKTLALAKEQFEREKAQVLDGTYCNKKGTLTEVFNKMLGSKTGIANSRKNYLQWAFDKHISPYLNGSKQIKSVTKEDLSQYKADLESNEKLAEQTKQGIWVVVKMIFKYATEMDYTPKDITYNKNYEIQKEREPEEVEPYSVSQQKALLDYSRNRRNKTAYIGFLLCIKAGLREGELLGLRWEDINFNTNRIIVDSQFNTNEKQETKTKTGNKRYVPMVSELFNALYSLKEERNPQESDFIMQPSYGKRKAKGLPLCSQDLWGVFHRVGEKVGISDTHPHRGRHTFATELKIHGADKDDIKRLMGHTLQGVTDGYIYSRIPYQPCTIKALMEMGKEVENNIIKLPLPNQNNQAKAV
jgi:integrase